MPRPPNDGPPDDRTPSRMPAVEIELMPDGADILQKVPFFARLSFQETHDLSAICRVDRKAAGEAIIEQDSMGSGLFIIRQGSAKVHLRDHFTGDVRELATLSEGDVFGEMSLIEDQLVSADVVAATDIEVLVLPRKEFEAMIAANNGLAVKIWRGFCRELSGKLRKANARISELSSRLGHSE